MTFICLQLLCSNNTFFVDKDERIGISYCFLLIDFILFLIEKAWLNKEK
jgi:hypothetical protein